MVQHRALLGLWHRWAGAGPLLRRLQDRQGARLGERLRAPAAACLLHPVGRRRSGQRRRRSEEHTSELQSPCNLVCRLLLEKKKKQSYLICTITKKKEMRS